MGQEPSEANLRFLIYAFETDYKLNQIPVVVKREIVSSIGRQEDKNKIREFILKWGLQPDQAMDVVYQLFRTCLYNLENTDNQSGIMWTMARNMLEYYENEVMEKMFRFYLRKRNKSKNRALKDKEKLHDKITQIKHPLVLGGKAEDVLPALPANSVQLIFTSPPYYNAREYANYPNYKTYLEAMATVLKCCYRVLEDGRFIVINVSPVISKRPGREFESTRYPIHYDFHNILTECGFYFIDEIYWIKPEPSVPNRIGGYMQTRKPLGYRPNCITESLMVYRKECDFLLDEIMQEYQEYDKHETEEINKTNCWNIAPVSSKNHPAVFPTELCRRVLKYYSFEGDTVLDPFAGSGTVGIVADKMKRIPILCESNQVYINLINRKLKKTVGD